MYFKAGKNIQYLCVTISAFHGPELRFSFSFNVLDTFCNIPNPLFSTGTQKNLLFDDFFTKNRGFAGDVQAIIDLDYNSIA